MAFWELLFLVENPQKLQFPEQHPFTFGIIVVFEGFPKSRPLQGSSVRTGPWRPLTIAGLSNTLSLPAGPVWVSQLPIGSPKPQRFKSQVHNWSLNQFSNVVVSEQQTVGMGSLIHRRRGRPQSVFKVTENMTAEKITHETEEIVSITRLWSAYVSH